MLSCASASVGLAIAASLYRPSSTESDVTYICGDG